MNDSNAGPIHDHLANLWVEYREACHEPDANAEFMPKLWRQIEARRIETESTFRRFARVCLAITAAVIILASISMPVPDNDEYSFATYVSLITADQLNEDFVQGIAVP